MTVADILTREENNWDKIILYKEGTFMKAYEHSAFLFCLHIREFKTKKRFVKNVNQDVVSLGFPEQSVPKWLYNRKYKWTSEKILECDLGVLCSETDFLNWKDSILINAGDKYTPNTRIIEKSTVYKNTYDLLLQIIRFSVNVSKNSREPIGNRLKALVYDLSYKVRNLYDVPDRNSHIDSAIPLCEEISYILQILCDLKEISKETFALAGERIESVSGQLVALRVKVKS